MGVGKQGNLIYVMSLNFVTKRFTAQINSGHTRNPHLIDTTRFTSINDHLNVDKCDILGSYAKTNA